MFNFIKNIGTTEIVLLVLILALIFGAKIITSLGRTGGETFKEIKKIKREITETLKDDGNQPNKS